MPTSQILGTATAAPVFAYISTLLVYLINGVAFHCWVDPTASGALAGSVTAAWTCPMHLPDFVSTAVQGIVTFLGTAATGWLIGPPKTGG